MPNNCPSLKGLYIARHDRLVDLIAAQIPVWLMKSSIN